MNRLNRLSAVALGMMLVLIIPLSQAVAQEELQYVPEELEMVEETDVGWTYALRLGLSTAFATASNVIGNPDGATWTLGFGVDGNLGLLRNNHEWRNMLNISETFSRTPVIDEFVKSGDLLNFESMYLYHVPSAPWFGPFARLRLFTAIFAGQDVRPADVNYLITRIGGSTETVTADRLDLTDPFQPITFKQSIGVFARPLARTVMQIEFLLGFGVRQTLAEDQLTVQDDDATAEIEVTELDTFIQAGAEATLSLWGEIVGGRVAYNAGAEFMIPFINSAELEQDKSAFELTNIDLTAGLSFRIVEWASLDYQFRALREPQLLDEFQIQNNLLLSIGYTLFERKAASVEAVEAAEAAEVAEEAAESAEEEAQEAEEAARRAEEAAAEEAARQAEEAAAEEAAAEEAAQEAAEAAEAAEEVLEEEAPPEEAPVEEPEPQ